MRRLRSSSSSKPAVAGEGAAGTSANTSTKRRMTDKRETLDVDVAMQMEQQQQENKDKLPDELWDKVLKSVDDNSVMAFALVCKQLRRVQQEAGRRLKTDQRIFRYPGYKEDEHFNAYDFTEDWFLWSLRILASSREEEISYYLSSPERINNNILFGMELLMELLMVNGLMIMIMIMSHRKSSR